MQNVIPPGAYEERLLLFVDILGFRAMVEKSRTDQTDALIRQLQVVIYALNEGPFLQRDRYNGKNPRSDYGAVITAFSDLIVVSTHVHDPYAVPWLLRAAFYIADQLMRHGMLCRGGIDYGLLYHTNRQIFGPALLDAYDLERSKPGYPRILFSQKALTLLEQIKNSTGKSLDEFVVQDMVDSKKYLNFLKCINRDANALDWKLAPFDKCLLNGQPININANSNGNVIKKYEWLRDKCVHRVPSELPTVIVTLSLVAMATAHKQ